MDREILKAFGFEEELKLIDAKKCPFCSKPVSENDFDDELSKKEFGMSGLCLACQSKVFK